MHKVYIIGMGPGGTEYVNQKAVETIKQCRYITGSARLLKDSEVFAGSGAEVYPLRKPDTCLAWIDGKQRQGDVAVLVSGDVHYYSLAGTIRSSSYAWNCVYLSGISSYQLMADKFGLMLENAALCSVHGRNESEGYVAYQAAKNAETFFLCSRNFPPERIADALCHYGYKDLLMCIGSNLGMKGEELFSMDAAHAADQTFSGMSVVYVKNPKPQHPEPFRHLRDEEFIRGKVPMTKEEIRILIVHRMAASPCDCVWDLGAGTGSVSIEMARQCPFGKVYSVEYKKDAIGLIRQNKEKFQCGNLEIIPQRISECMHLLPEPDRVFLGGSEGEFPFVVSYLKNLSKKVHFVMTAVTMESLSEAIRMFSGMDSFRYMQVQVGHSHMVGSYHTTDMNHPIWILEVDLS